jgi:predicted nucleotidyltransferase
MNKNKSKKKKASKKKPNLKNAPSLDLKTEPEIAMDFATKTYKKFDKIIKSIILFGSATKQAAVGGSDIDVVIVIDDATINWDTELTAWYRQELDKILRENPYGKELHINTVKLTTWWEDLLAGDPTVVNILRYGEAMIDFGGFFNPLKALLVKGKIKSTPEAIYNALQRAPQHLARSKASELNAIEGLYWSMVDSSHAALIAADVLPPSPEHIPVDLKDTFVNEGKLKMKYVVWYRDVLMLHKKIMHGDVRELKGVELDLWQERAEDFMKTMAQLVDSLIE